MSERFEAGEARVRVQPPALPFVRRVVLLLGVLWCLHGADMPTGVIRNIVSLLVGSNAALAGRYWYLLVNGFALVTQLAGLLAAGGMVLALVRAWRLRRSVPAHPVVVRGDSTGLHADDRCIVARRDVASAEVAVDPDVGFVVVVRSRDGATVRVPLGNEADARALAAVLDPAGAQNGGLVFEGVADARWRETLVAAAPVVGAAAFAVASASPTLGDLGFWSWVDRTAVRFYEQPGTVMFWVVFCVACLGTWAAIALAVLAARPVARRMRRGRIVVDGAGVVLGEGKAARRVSREDIQHVEADDSPQVKLALRDGRAVRLRFSADRAVVERDAFVARVRAMLTETPIETYSAAETSGVRVALEADAPSPLDDEGDLEPQAPRARRR